MMIQGKYVFAQLIEFLPSRFFDGIVEKYIGNRYVKHFTCWNQLLVMIFGQLSNRDSLRELIISLDAHSQKSYHLGFGKSVTRSNLAKANESRDYRIFEELAYYLICTARKKLSNDDFEVKGKVYAFDSTTIDLCLSVFWWANFRKTKGGIKIHTLYDITTQIPAFVHITDASMSVRAECVMLNKGPYIMETINTLYNILQRMETHQNKKTGTLRQLSFANIFFKLDAERFS